jgi:hypothetical protein
MKLILTLILCALVTGVQAEIYEVTPRSIINSISGTGTSSLYTYPGCTSHEYECTICGKTLFEHKETRSGWSSWSTLSVSSCERDDGKTLTIPWSIKVCQDCYDKYLPSIKKITKEMEELTKAMRQDAVKERLINEEKRRVQKLKDVQIEVDRLQQRLKELGK